jgi:TatD DNase family protein
VIDFHCHLDLYPDPAEVARQCAQRGLYVLSVTTTPSAYLKTSELANTNPRIRTALGIHPQVARERHAEIDQFEALIARADYVGEIGLDGAPEFRSSWDIQSRVFQRCLEIAASAGGRVMSLHSRRAASAVLDALQKVPRAGTPVLHWFSGTERELRRAAELGCWFSVGPGMLRSESGRRLAAKMPRDRLLIESDGPFVRVGERAIWPWEAEDALSWFAGAWAVDLIRAEEVFAANLLAMGKLARVERAM